MYVCLIFVSHVRMSHVRVSHVRMFHYRVSHVRMSHVRVSHLRMSHVRVSHLRILPVSPSIFHFTSCWKSVPQQAVILLTPNRRKEGFALIYSDSYICDVGSIKCTQMTAAGAQTENTIWE
jgi:hypothetical protein